MADLGLKHGSVRLYGLCCPHLILSDQLNLSTRNHSGCNLSSASSWEAYPPGDALPVIFSWLQNFWHPLQSYGCTLSFGHSKPTPNPTHLLSTSSQLFTSNLTGGSLSPHYPSASFLKAVLIQIGLWHTLWRFQGSPDSFGTAAFIRLFKFIRDAFFPDFNHYY